MKNQPNINERGLGFIEKTLTPRTDGDALPYHAPVTTNLPHPDRKGRFKKGKNKKKKNSMDKMNELRELVRSLIMELDTDDYEELEFDDDRKTDFDDLENEHYEWKQLGPKAQRVSIEVDEDKEMIFKVVGKTYDPKATADGYESNSRFAVGRTGGAKTAGHYPYKHYIFKYVTLNKIFEAEFEAKVDDDGNCILERLISLNILRSPYRNYRSLT
jgi:hypothetical protein